MSAKRRRKLTITATRAAVCHSNCRSETHSPHSCRHISVSVSRINTFFCGYYELWISAKRRLRGGGASAAGETAVFVIWWSRIDKIKIAKLGANGNQINTSSPQVLRLQYLRYVWELWLRHILWFKPRSAAGRYLSARRGAGLTPPGAKFTAAAEPYEEPLLAETLAAYDQTVVGLYFELSQRKQSLWLQN